MPSFDEETIESVYEKEGGCCTYCEKRIAWKNYGQNGARGSWEVDHSLPLSRGGTDHLNNLVPACTECNKRKGDMTASEFRSMLEAERKSDEVTLGQVVAALVALGGAVYLLRRADRRNIPPGRRGY